MKVIMDKQFIPLPKYNASTEDEMLRQSSEFYAVMNSRRSVREFSSRPIPREIIEICIRTASTAPSGANKQPWHFVVVSNPEVKKQIRAAAEKEEYEFYHQKAPQEWLNDLAPLGTDEHKPFLEEAPYLIVIFEKKYGVTEDGKKEKYYYTSESVGIATGLLITAFHRIGLATLTHTPSPMKFLNKILNRPENEKPFLILVVGYPGKDAEVPDIKRKTLSEIAEFK